LRGRPWSWITGRPRLADSLAVAFTVVTGLIVIPFLPYRSTMWVTVAVVAVQGVALWWRRRRPFLVLAIVVISILVEWRVAPERELSSPALAFAVYAESVYDRSPARVWVGGIAIVITVAAVLGLLLGQFSIVRGIIPGGAISLVAWVIGDYMRSRRQFFTDIVARHRQEREQAAEEERMRIARELHDVVAHNVSVMAIQAGAARVAGNNSKDALQSIETTARDTLAELNHLLGVLRKDSDAPLSPQPGLDQVETLVNTARQAGLESSLKVTGEHRPLPAALDLSAYRILQEAITNVLKHAQATRVEVTIAYQPDAVLLTVSDNGMGVQQRVGAATGHGLIGMRERVELFNGELTAGSGSLGGYTVHATLPLSPPGRGLG
jgi:signal transduction histidine kinase